MSAAAFYASWRSQARNDTRRLCRMYRVAEWAARVPAKGAHL